MALHDQPDASTFDAPADYLNRYSLFSPATTLQNVNLSPDFPSVAEALMSLAPQAGLTKVDGVMAVDPAGLAALPRDSPDRSMVEGWPTQITSANVVKTTLSDACTRSSKTCRTARGLSRRASRRSRSTRRPRAASASPLSIAKVLGAAAHQGHIILAFARPEEQRLAVELGVSGKMEPVRSDAIALTTSNMGGNKIDYYLQRNVDYSVHIDPDADATSVDRDRHGLERPRSTTPHRPRGSPST